MSPLKTINFNTYFLLSLGDEVKYGTIKNLSNFLQVFDHEKRENLVDVFLHLQVNINLSTL